MSLVLTTLFYNRKIYFQFLRRDSLCYDEIVTGYETRFWKLPRRTADIDFGIMEKFAAKNHRRLVRALQSERHPMSKFNDVVRDLQLFPQWSSFKEDYYRKKLIKWAKEHGIACPDK